MQGHVARKRDRYYAVIYEGLDPVTGKEHRSWHPAGTDRAEAAALVARLAAERDGRNDEVRSLTFGAYLTHQWLPAKRLELRVSTHRSYVHKTQRHILPTLGRKRLRRLRPEDLERLYNAMLQPKDGTRALAPKTVYEVHLIIRGALDHALRRGLVSRNVALAASAPKLRAIPKPEQKTWTADELQAFLRAAAGHRLFPALWLSANTGMRRSELLGLKWSDLDVAKKRLSINRGLVAVGYELHESRGKTNNSRRCIDLDQTTLAVLAGWRTLQAAEFAAVGIDDPGWMFTSASGGPVHPHSISQSFDRIVRRSPVPVIPFHGLRHTHASLLIANDVDAKVASERLGHSEFVFTVQSYQHTFPGMHTDAARVIEALLTPRASENPKVAKAG
ncbi:MAG: site-specific integrase [Microthrixaceae bacterium]|jgi:integrase|nr:site-specific integrase [Microthrixaceae bacterium]